LKEYINSDGIKRIVLYPEGRILQYEERLELACSLLITLPKAYGMRSPYVFTREVRKRVKAKMKRYKKWRAKQQD